MYDMQVKSRKNADMMFG